ncbi:TonB-dependent copper receptor [Nibricoccus aquaticus]|uniref:TonB-dependent copper receptor n=1 Tax=Nibricoccus aquaticus TaxID=2576891 RepID=A0A290Q4D9_9BACT|nr:TonB-dependent copper receptor [Nibricoccus aquaticus]ATC63157.1 TonB-dependent copper receptor [Nibricoccus aquaticus]
MNTPRRSAPLRRIALVSLSVLALAAAPAHAQSSDTSPEFVVALAPIVVTARPSERPLAVEVDPRAPAQPIPAQDGAEALCRVAGFNIIRKGGTSGDPVFRGMAGSRLGIMLDGENILGGCGNRMDPPTAYVFPSAYDNITVLKGPQSVLHGAGHSAGVVLFERTPRRFTEPSVQFSSALTVGSFDRNDQFAEIRAGRPLGYVEIAATRTAANDYEDGEGRLVHSAYERWSTRAALGWTPSDNTLVELTGTLGDGEAAYADRMMDGAKFARQNLGLRFRQSELPGLISSVEANVFFNAVDHVMDNYSQRAFTPTMMMPTPSASNPDRLTLGARTSAKLTFSENLRATLGLDHQSNRHRARNTSNETLDPFESKPWIKDAAFSVSGLFAESIYELTPSDRIIGGARLDRWHAEDFRSTVSTGMMSTALNPTAGRERTDTLPSAFLRFERDLCCAGSFFVGLGHSQRFPDYWELFGKESASTVSSFDTLPERTTQLDAGFTRRVSTTFTVTLSVFANRIDDFILIDSGIRKPAGMTGTRAATIARNIDARSFGGEASATWAFAKNWTLDAALSAVSADNTTDDRPLAQQPPHESRLGLAYATSRWSVGTLARFVARQSRYALNQGNIVGQDLGPSDSFEVFSLNAAYKPTARLQFSVGVDNLFDTAYAEHLSRGGNMVAGFPAPTTRVQEPGRAAWLKLDFKY